jgi:hypothetical protein
MDEECDKHEQTRISCTKIYLVVREFNEAYLMGENTATAHPYRPPVRLFTSQDVQLEASCKNGLPAEGTVSPFLQISVKRDRVHEETAERVEQLGKVDCKSSLSA